MGVGGGVGGIYDLFFIYLIVHHDFMVKLPYDVYMYIYLIIFIHQFLRFVIHPYTSSTLFTQIER